MENNVNRIIDGLRFRTFDKVYKNVKMNTLTSLLAPQFRVKALR